MKSNTMFQKWIAVFCLLFLLNTISFALINAQQSPQIVALDWSPNGEMIASVSSDGQLVVRTASNQPIFNVQASAEFLSAVEWSPTSELIATGGDDELIRIWNVSSSQYIQGQLLATLEGHGVRNITSLDWNQNNLLASSGFEPGNYGARLVIWDMDDYSPLQEVPACDLLEVVWKNNSELAFVGECGSVFVVNTATNARQELASDHLLTAVVWNTQGNLLIAGDPWGEIVVLDATTGTALKTIAAHSSVIDALAWNPTLNLLASSSRDGTIKVWDADFESPIVTLQRTTEYTNNLAWSPDGSQLAYVSPEGSVEITDLSLMQTVIISDDDPIPSPLVLSEETRAWYNYTLTLSATLTGSESVTVRLDYYPPTPSNYAHVQTRVQRDPPLSWSTAQTLVFDANHTEYEVRIRARDDSTNLTGAVGRLGHRITASNVAGYPVNSVDASGMRLTGSPFSGGNDAAAAADSRNVLVFTVEDND